MIKELKHSVILQDYQRFLDNFPGRPALQLEYFHPIHFPVVITEAHVKMRAVQDYSVLSLLILRLFDAGIHSPEAIQSISGMSLRTVRTYIEKEQLLLEHIDPNTNQLTEMGRETLRANENRDGRPPESVQYYDSVLRVHIDPITASLIPQYLEREDGLVDNVTPNQEAGVFLLPRESAPTDEDFLKELKNRLKELVEDINANLVKHIQWDIVKNGDILNSIVSFRPVRIFYRWGYLARFRGMRSPMVVFTGKKTVSTANASSLAAGVRDTIVTLPIVLANSDKTYLEKNGICFPRVIVRRDTCFDELIRLTQNMTLTLPDLSIRGEPEDLAEASDEETRMDTTEEEPEDDPEDAYLDEEDGDEE